MKLAVIVLALAFAGTALAAEPSKTYRRWEIALSVATVTDMLSTSLVLNTGGRERMAWIVGDKMEQIAPRSIGIMVTIHVGARKIRKTQPKVARNIVAASALLRFAATIQNIQEYRR